MQIIIKITSFTKIIINMMVKQHNFENLIVSKRE